MPTKAMESGDDGWLRSSPDMSSVNAYFRVTDANSAAADAAFAARLTYACTSRHLRWNCSFVAVRTSWRRQWLQSNQSTGSWSPERVISTRHGGAVYTHDVAACAVARSNLPGFILPWTSPSDV